MKQNYFILLILYAYGFSFSQEKEETNNSKLFWEAHLVGKDKEYWHMEQLVNLNVLPYSGFKVAVFPLKIINASAAPARVVAIFE
jgi:kynurenine formamidase